MFQLYSTGLTERDYNSCKHYSSQSQKSTKLAKFKPQHNKTIPSLQYCTLIREQNENAGEWMGHLRIKVNKCEYKENEDYMKNLLMT